MTDIPPPVAMMTITVPNGPPSPSEVAKRLGIATLDIDPVFGVVPIDPERGLYAVQVRADKLPGKSGQKSKDYDGPWSNPKIVPFGPVKDGGSKD